MSMWPLGPIVKLCSVGLLVRIRCLSLRPPAMYCTVCYETLDERRSAQILTTHNGSCDCNKALYFRTIELSTITASIAFNSTLRPL